MEQRTHSVLSDLWTDTNIFFLQQGASCYVVLIISSPPTHFSSVRKSFYLLPWKPFFLLSLSLLLLLSSFCFSLLLSAIFSLMRSKTAIWSWPVEYFGFLLRTWNSQAFFFFFFFQGINTEWVATKGWRRKRYVLSADCALVTMPVVFTYPASHRLHNKSAGQAGQYYDPILQEKQV